MDMTIQEEIEQLVLIKVHRRRRAEGMPEGYFLS